uniref:BTB domain-containing protein n=1 Tax=Arcella intermedia TaxID=1963864 RepID=A0A6B2L1L8_9EUKA
MLLVTKAIFYIVQWERARTMALGIGVLTPLFSLLKSSHRDVVQNAVSSISELACYELTRTMILSSPDSLKLLIAQLGSDLTQTQYVTACTISNLALGGDKEFNTFMIEEGVLKPLFELLKSPDSDVMYATLCAMWNIEAQNKYLRFVLLKLPQIISVLPAHNEKVKDVALEIIEGYLENQDLSCIDFILNLINTNITFILYASQPTTVDTTRPDNTIQQKMQYIKDKLEKVARRIACFRDLLDNDEKTLQNCAVALPFLIKKKEDKIFAFVKRDWLEILVNCLMLGSESIQEKASLSMKYLLSGVSVQETKIACPKKNPTSEFTAALNQKGVSDVQFNVRGKVIYASKLILTSRSEYFRSLLLGGMSESSQTEISIPSIEPDIFLKVLEYLYSYTLTFSSTEEGIKILQVADQYQINDLKSLCETELGSNWISSSNLGLLYETSVNLNAKQLQYSCVKWLLVELRDNSKLVIPEGLDVDKIGLGKVLCKVVRRSLKNFLSPRGPLFENLL